MMLLGFSHGVFIILLFIILFFMHEHILLLLPGILLGTFIRNGGIPSVLSSMTLLLASLLLLVCDVCCMCFHILHLMCLW